MTNFYFANVNKSHIGILTNLTVKVLPYEAATSLKKYEKFYCQKIHN